MIGLVVTDPFHDPQHGHIAANTVISDPDEMARWQASDRAHHFMRVALPDPVEAAPEPEAQAEEAQAEEGERTEGKARR